MTPAGLSHYVCCPHRYPHKQKPLEKLEEEGMIDPEKNHLSEYCEKCKRLGRPCNEESRKSYVWF
jgi:hypothetical protein